RFAAAAVALGPPDVLAVGHLHADRVAAHDAWRVPGRSSRFRGLSHRVGRSRHTCLGSVDRQSGFAVLERRELVAGAASGASGEGNCARLRASRAFGREAPAPRARSRRIRMWRRRRRGRAGSLRPSCACPESRRTARARASRAMLFLASLLLVPLSDLLQIQKQMEKQTRVPNPEPLRSRSGYSPELVPTSANTRPEISTT